MRTLTLDEMRMMLGMMPPQAVTQHTLREARSAYAA